MTDAQDTLREALKLTAVALREAGGVGALTSPSMSNPWPKA